MLIVCPEHTAYCVLCTQWNPAWKGGRERCQEIRIRQSLGLRIRVKLCSKTSMMGNGDPTGKEKIDEKDFAGIDGPDRDAVPDPGARGLCGGKNPYRRPVEGARSSGPEHRSCSGTGQPRRLRGRSRRRPRPGKSALLGHAGGERRDTGMRQLPLPGRGRRAGQEPDQPRIPFAVRGHPLRRRRSERHAPPGGFSLPQGPQ